MIRRFWPVLLSACLCAPMMAHAQAVFDLVDTDGDGFVTREEMDAARLARFMELDRNGDGQVDRSELMVGPGQGRKGYTAEQTQAVLAAYDHNGDGIITLDEVTEAIERLNVFSGLDTDGDGKLTREEAEGVLDIRVRGGINRDQILDDLAQGKRSTAGFRPVKGEAIMDPFEQARIHGTTGVGSLAASDLTSARRDGWVDPTQPSVWNDPNAPGVVTIRQDGARDGYVARMVEPTRVGTMSPTLPGAVPPGASASTPYYAGPAPTSVVTASPLPTNRAAGANWREVDIGADGRPLN